MTKILYLISFYKLPNQLFRLVNVLEHPDNYLVIHVDRQVEDETYELVKAKLSQYKNVFFCKREYSSWGSFGFIKGTMNGIILAKKLKLEYDFVTKLSVQDYPIKTNEYISNYLSTRKDQSFLYNFPLMPKPGEPFFEKHPWGPKRNHNRFEKIHIRHKDKMYVFPIKDFENKSITIVLKHFLKNILRLSYDDIINLWYSLLYRKKREFLTGYEPYGGSTWWTLSKTAADYLLHVHLTNKRLNDFFKTVVIIDEMYYQTILLNSPFKDEIVSDNLRYIYWDQSKPDHPVVLTMEHYRELKNSEALFARKFDETIDKAVLDKIDSEIIRETADSKPS